MQSSADTGSRDRTPPQIKYIIGNEICERFSFYGMLGILTLYIARHLGQGDAKATEIAHMFKFGVYFLPLFGAWLSDRVLGRYRTILYISLFYCAGHAVLAMSELTDSVDNKLYLLYGGLVLLSLGAGGLKPCVSAFVGDQFKTNQSHLLQKAYGLFYWSINFGAFFAFLAIPRIRDTHGYGWAFGIPGLFMGLATLIFWKGRHYYERVPSAGDKPSKILYFVPPAILIGLLLWLQHREVPGLYLLVGVVALMIPLIAWMAARQRSLYNEPVSEVQGGFYEVLAFAAFNRHRRTASESRWQVARKRYTEESVEGTASALRVLGIFSLIPFFWALWDQNSTTWVLQGDRMQPYTLSPGMRSALGWLFGDTIGAEQMQSLNALLVMGSVPLYLFVIFPLIERIGIRVTTLRRMGVGIFLAASSFVIVAWIEQQLVQGRQLSVLWQTWPYIVLTLGEVLVSNTGLEFAFREASRSMRSTLMSFWLLTTAVGNLAVAQVTRLNVRGKLPGGGDDLYISGVAQFYLYAALLAVVGIIFVFVARRYRYREMTPEANPA